MLTLLKIRNIALIDELTIEFGPGLNLLTGETGSGKSIIVDSLGVLTGARVTSDLIRNGQETASVEGIFAGAISSPLAQMLTESGIDADDDELIVRRELTSAGKNRVFLNGRAVTQGFLKSVGPFLADIHGQGDQAALYDPATHLGLLDSVIHLGEKPAALAGAFQEWTAVRAELASLKSDEAEKLQLTDLLRFQVSEIETAGLRPGEDTELEDEKRRLNNVEKLTQLGTEAFAALYDNEESTVATLERAQRRVDELAGYDEKFAAYDEGLRSARAVVEDLAHTLRDMVSHLEFSPERLAEIDERLAEISRLKRKYGGSVESILAHLDESRTRLENIDSAEARESELNALLAKKRDAYLALAMDVHEARVAAARKFEKDVQKGLAAVALEKARFEVRFQQVDSDVPDEQFTPAGVDIIEFYFSANPGEQTRPLARVASGGEASRVMLIVKTAAGSDPPGKTAVFDEVDSGIGGRAAEAVGRKLGSLAATQQVLCVTHQPQIAAQADHHFVIEKKVASGRTTVVARPLNSDERVEEIARMLAGEHITDAARENARQMLALVGSTAGAG